MAWVIYPGLIAGAMASQSAYYPAFIAFAVPLIGSCAWVLTGLGRAEYGMMPLILIVFFICVLLVAKRYSETLADALGAKGRLAETNQKLTQMAIRDVLTGVPNRRAFEYQLQREWGRGLRYNTQMTLLCVMKLAVR